MIPITQLPTKRRFRRPVGAEQGGADQGIRLPIIPRFTDGLPHHTSMARSIILRGLILGFLGMGGLLGELFGGGNAEFAGDEFGEDAVRDTLLVADDLQLINDFENVAAASATSLILRHDRLHFTGNRFPKLHDLRVINRVCRSAAGASEACGPGLSATAGYVSYHTQDLSIRRQPASIGIKFH